MKKFILLSLTFIFTQAFLALNASADSTGANSTPSVQAERIGVYKCGRQPKQVVFSPDGEYIVMPLLEDDGFDIFSIKEKKIIKRINPPNAKKVGFAEGIFVPSKNAFFVSQMTTATVYEYTYPGFEYKRAIPTNAVWSKIIEWCPQKNMLAVSNWCSNDVSLINYDSGKVITKLRTGKAPRGLYFYDGGKKLLVLSYESGTLEAFDTESFARINKLEIPKASMRHAAPSADGKTVFISDMYYAKVYKFDLESFTITAKFSTFHKPNTIALYKNRYLFISCRGPNNPVDYTRRSPENGKIQVIDTKNMTLLKEIPGGNQPTGLALSPDGTMLCFSNFQDYNIELYKISIDQ